MTTSQEIDRVECAIRHIESSLDVDPWARDIAVEAMLRRIPREPTEAEDSSWGIRTREAACPICGSYLGHVSFLGDGENRITYCETCGQAIDWNGWEEEDEVD